MTRLWAVAVLASGMMLSGCGTVGFEIDEAFATFQAEVDRESRVAAGQGSHAQLRQRAVEAYERLFRAQLTDAKLKTLSSVDLGHLHLAAQIVGTYAIEERYARDMLAVLNELESRGDATKSHYKATYRMLVAVRDLAGARRLTAKYRSEELEVLPTVRAGPEAGKGPAVWLLSEDPNEVVSARVDVETGRRIVVVSHPLCRFSSNASSAIAADDVLGPVFRSYATWIAPQSGKLDLPVLQQWNREHRDFDVGLVVRQTEWTFIDYWGTPTFYFLKDGAVVQKVIGWPQEGRREELLDAARKAGMLQ